MSTASKPQANLFKGAEKGKVEVALKALDAGAELEAGNEHGSRALHLACREGRLELVQLLLTRGADSRAINRRGCTPLHEALLARSNAPNADLDARVRIVELLLARGVSADAEDSLGRRPLWLASSIRGDCGKTVVAMLLERASDLTGTGRDGYTLLHMGCIFGHTELVRRCLAAGLPVNAKEQSGGTALFHACYFGDVEAAMLLFEAGADACVVSNEGWNPLHRLCGSDEARNWAQTARFGGPKKPRSAADALVELLLSRGARLDERDAKGWTPVELAAQRGSVEVVAALLAAGAEPGRVLHLAVETTSSDKMGRLVDAVLAHGVDVESHGEDGLTPLARALSSASVTTQRAKAAIRLLEAGASSDTPIQETPLRVLFTDPARVAAAFGHDAKFVQPLVSFASKQVANGTWTQR